MAYSPATVLKKLIEERVLDLRLQGAKTLKYLAANGQVVSGTQDDFYWDVIVNGSTVAGATMATAGTNQGVGETAQATLRIGGFKLYHQFSLERTAMKNAASAGVGSLKRLFRMHIDSGIIELRRKINAAIWNGDGSAAYGGIVGIQKALAPGVYAGLDSATYPLWTPILNSSATARALTRDLLYELTKIQEENEVSSDIFFISPTMAKTYQQLFDNIAGAYSIPGVELESRATDLGYNVMAYQGVPILTDPMCPNGQFIGFGMNDVQLITYDLANADQGELNAIGQKDNFGTISSATVEGMNVNVALLPDTNPGQITFQMFVVPQLKIANRRTLQGITNLL